MRFSCRRARPSYSTRPRPDEETSDRVVAAAGNKVTRLTATMLELQDTKAQGLLVRKLREAGIFTPLMIRGGALQAAMTGFERACLLSGEQRHAGQTPAPRTHAVVRWNFAFGMRTADAPFPQGRRPRRTRASETSVFVPVSMYRTARMRPSRRSSPATSAGGVVAVQDHRLELAKKRRTRTIFGSDIRLRVPDECRQRGLFGPAASTPGVVLAR
jgi:hypothetical protein